MPDNDEAVQTENDEIKINDLDPGKQPATGILARLESVFLYWQRPGKRRPRLWLGTGLLVGLVCVLLAIIFSPATGLTALLASRWPQKGAQAALSLAVTPQPPSIDGIACPTQTAWSPDSTLIAVLGYTRSCATGAYVPAQVNLYDATNAHEVAHWQPDQAVLTALLHSPYVSPLTHALLNRKPDSTQAEDPSAAPDITYQQIIWSPDHTRLALSFLVTTRTITYAGVFLAKIDGSHTQVLLQPTLAQSRPFQQGPTLLWNLQSGSATPLTGLAPALVYAWNQRDQLLPVSRLSAVGEPSVSTTTAPGNPDGGRTFTIWQPGRPLVLSLMHTPSAYMWSTGFAAWSPDGHDLITNFTFMGLMELPGHAFPAASAMNEMVAHATPRLAPHDPALIPTSFIAQTVAWNPAGTVLAVYDLTGAIELYDAYTGALLRELKPLIAHPLSGSAILLSWSPNGRTLALSSAGSGLLTLWGRASLPH
jgi:WD40 repeat protein